MMEAVRFGNSGLRVSPMCLGTMMFGTHTDLQTSRRIADLAIDRGVFFWDTADMYGKGASEEVCGKLMEGRRQEIVLATKVWAKMSQNPNDQGLSARNIIQACEASLRRLKTEWIDIYYLHLPDSGTPIEETLRAVEDLRRSGKIRYVACSNYRSWQILDLVHAAQRNGWAPVQGIQPLYNIVNRDIEVEMLPMAAHHGLGVCTYSPLARGVLTGKYSQGVVPPGSRLARKDPRFLQAEWRESSVTVAEKLQEVADGIGCTSGQLATAWVMRNTLVHSVIIGPKTVEQAKESLDSALVRIDQSVEDHIDSLVPPGCHSGREFFDHNYAPVLGRIVE